MPPASTLNGVTDNMVTVVAVYESVESAQRAMDYIERSGHPTDKISVVARDTDAADAIKNQKASNQGTSGAGAGASIGGVGGGAVGALLGAGVIAIPGAGAVVAAGWLAGALGGALAGAAAGGWVGSLVNLGVPEDTANRYNEQVQKGNYLLMVQGDKDFNPDEVADELRNSGSNDVEIYSVEAEPGDRPGSVDERT